MKTEYAALPHTPLQAGSHFVHKARNPELVHMDSPAIDVMTDLSEHEAVSCSPEMPIDDALEHMKQSGVRLLFVVSDDESVLGLVSARDVMGDVPVRLVQEERIARSSIPVKRIMHPPADISVLDMVSVHGAEVRHIVEILQHLGRRHLLVVETADNGQQTVVGLFSLAQISHQLPRELAENIAPAHSLAELVHASAH